MRYSSIVFGLFLGAAINASADSKVEEQVVGPVIDIPNAKYIVSPRGVHLASVAPKGSRVNVIVDGVAGPRFDDIIETTRGVIDPRPYFNVDPNSQPRGAAVTFSRDGSRYAYVGRLGQEWVLMVDNKEMLRLPVTGAVGASTGIAGTPGATEMRIEFTGESGKHLLFARSVYEGNEMWCDGQKWPGFFGSGGGGSDGTIDPVISADGEHVAYMAQITREKRSVIVDGKDAGYPGTNLQFTPDSKHLVALVQLPKGGQAVLIDGKSLPPMRQIIGVYLAPVGTRLIIAAMHFNKEGNAAEGSYLVVDGKPVEATLTRASVIPKVIFSPDGKHYAALCGSAPNQFVVIDGKKGQEYFNIQPDPIADLTPGMSFSPDSSKLVYVAATPTGQFFVVTNDDESDALQNPWYKFSADGKHFAYGGMMNQGQRTFLSVDGKPVPLPPGWFVSLFTFSPDGSHYAFAGSQGGNRGIFLDGKNTGVSGEFAFSPDGKHLAIVGMSATDPNPGLFVDGQHVFNNYDKAIVARGFTPDSQHLVWMTREPAIGAKAAPGVWQFVTYVDGVSAVRCDSLMDAQGTLRNLYGFSNNPWAMRTGWNTTTAGALTFLGPVEGEIKRFTVAAPADTTIETMISEAKATPARAAAKAAEEKKKAAEAAAAKKAAAEDAAAEAAAKAKADYEAALAKRKADYDAAVAKRKADYEAAMAARAEQIRQQQQQQKK